MLEFLTSSHLIMHVQVLLTTCKAMAPFTPFFTEVLYLNLRKLLGPSAKESIHFSSFPEVKGEVIIKSVWELHHQSCIMITVKTLKAFFIWMNKQTNERIEKSVARMMTIIDLARNIRERHNKALKVPLRLIASCTDCVHFASCP